MSTSDTDVVGDVQHRTEAGRWAEAVRTIRAVLETLGERVEEGGATDIASPLPMEIDRYLLDVDHGHTYGYDGFVDRVLERLNYEDLDLDTSYGRPSAIDRAEAVYRIKAVVELLSERVPEGELAHVEEQFADMFEFVDAETTPWEEA
ncbi:DUF2267 domain-containing protein [Haloarchaeobius amylolyticus]|uniref:DUF2267 domain-containing protein n=1 Tax=Haloarchaeobius amylolyticus TaxID=1198296 RepID=A0ABD6BM37_9EURY